MEISRYVTERELAAILGVRVETIHALRRRYVEGEKVFQVYIMNGQRMYHRAKSVYVYSHYRKWYKMRSRWDAPTWKQYKEEYMLCT